MVNHAAVSQLTIVTHVAAPRFTIVIYVAASQFTIVLCSSFCATDVYTISSDSHAQEQVRVKNLIFMTTFWLRCFDD